jgi:hypothetical protein
MRSRLKALAIAALIGLQPAAGWSQQLYVYPAANQSPEQQSRDQQECHGWAMQQTGYNPYATSSAPASGGVLRGAAGGAALGAIGGAIAGDAGEGAKIGAVAGGLFGGVRQHRERQQQTYQYQQQSDAYARAFTACMEGRGYRVQ